MPFVTPKTMLAIPALYPKGLDTYVDQYHKVHNKRNLVHIHTMPLISNSEYDNLSVRQIKNCSNASQLNLTGWVII